MIKLKCFKNWVLLPFSSKKRGKRTENLSVGPPG
jgi:hypothetical protein